VNNFQKTIVKYSVYLEELRQRLFNTLKIFVVVFIVGVLSMSSILHIIIRYTSDIGVTIITTSPFQMVNLAMSIGFFAACLVTIPIFIYHFYSFLKPALLPKESKFFLLSLPMGFILFVSGFLYSSVMLFYAIKWIAVMNHSFGVANYWDVTSFLSQVIMASIYFGLVFEFPIVLTFMIRMGLLKVEFLKKNRRYAMAIIFIFVGLLPPPEFFTTIIQAAPLVFLYEITIQFNSVFYKRPKKVVVEIENKIQT